jgi:hypothetical protein
MVLLPVAATKRQVQGARVAVARHNVTRVWFAPSVRQKDWFQAKWGVVPAFVVILVQSPLK